MAGLAAGLAAAPYFDLGPDLFRPGLACLLAVVLIGRERSMVTAGFLAIFLAAGVTGLGLGGVRMESIEAGALEAEPGSRLETVGYLVTPPKTSGGSTRTVLSTSEGKVFLEAVRLPDGIGVGEQVAVRGVARRPEPWQADRLRLLGTTMVLRADSARGTGRVRGGLPGIVDGLRRRAEMTLSMAMPAREASLARGFVLGQDQDIPTATVEDFRDSGLAHLLAVSGQNVILLGLLAIPLLSLAGLGHEGRLLVLAGLILIYVPVAGGGPSIQRAGVMGLAALAAAAVDRPVMRAWSLCLAAAITLGLNPLAATDPGWQLSFAAVVGIALLARPLADRLTLAIAGRGGTFGRALADGFGVTLAASIITLPLIAFHFERVPISTVTANLLALPAVAPSMWLGMTAAALGQVAPVLAVPLNLLNSVLLAFIARLAGWLGGEGWSTLGLVLDSSAELIGAYLLLGAGTGLILLLTGPTGLPGRPARGSMRQAVVLASVTLLVFGPVLAGLLGTGRRNLPEPPPGGARIEFLDIGQGDSILIRPSGEDPVLVDFGPPGAEVVDALRSASLERLSAAVLTHLDLDHAGGLFDVLESIPVGTLMYQEVDRATATAARRAGSRLLPVSTGDRFRLGPVAIEVLWPPRRSESGPLPDSERNGHSIVLLVEWRQRRILLTADAEAEEVPLFPGRLDVLKVAHHGSDDAGLPRLLESTSPGMAVISAGAGNPHGHPTEGVLASLAEAGVQTLRTDRQGTVSVVFGAHGTAVETDR